MAGFLCPHGSHHAGFFVSFFFTPSYYHPPFGGMIYFAPTADRGDTPWHHAPNRFGRIRWHTHQARYGLYQSSGYLFQRTM